MAPPLKGQSDGDKRGLPDFAVISAAPKRYRVEADEDDGMVTAAQIAMLGGQWKPSSDDVVRFPPAAVHVYSRKNPCARSIHELASCLNDLTCVSL